jgi:hypothetical protein
MNDLNMIQLAVGVFCGVVLAISGAFIVYWNLFAKKQLFVPQQKPREIKLSKSPVYKAGSASFQHN